MSDDRKDIPPAAGILRRKKARARDTSSNSSQSRATLSPASQSSTEAPVPPPSRSIRKSAKLKALSRQIADNTGQPKPAGVTATAPADESPLDFWSASTDDSASVASRGGDSIDFAEAENDAADDFFAAFEEELAQAEQRASEAIEARSAEPVASGGVAVSDAIGPGPMVKPLDFPGLDSPSLAGDDIQAFDDDAPISYVEPAEDDFFAGLEPEAPRVAEDDGIAGIAPGMTLEATGPPSADPVPEGAFPNALDLGSPVAADQQMDDVVFGEGPSSRGFDVDDDHDEVFELETNAPPEPVGPTDDQGRPLFGAMDDFGPMPSESLHPQFGTSPSAPSVAPAASADHEDEVFELETSMIAPTSTGVSTVGGSPSHPHPSLSAAESPSRPSPPSERRLLARMAALEQRLSAVATVAQRSARSSTAIPIRGLDRPPGRTDPDEQARHAEQPVLTPDWGLGGATGMSDFGTTEAANRVDLFLRLMIDRGASDFHLHVGASPMFRQSGSMVPMRYRPIRQADWDRLIRPITPPGLWQRFEMTGDADFAYEVEGLARFRVNLMRQQNGGGAVFRVIPTKIMTLEELGMPPAVASFAEFNSGLILVTGPTGSGKSTTLAALIDLINRRNAYHIITIEDPIEFVHEDRRSVIHQREIGTHSASFTEALSGAVREDPDLILVGEMRDRETMSLALSAAEKGVLVLATLHTNSATKTVDRIVGTFPVGEQYQVRGVLADTLRGVVSQQLLRKLAGGRVAALEILFSSTAMANLVREGKTHQLTSLIQTGSKRGMVTMDDSLIDLVRKKVVAPESALEKAIDKDAFRQMARSAGV